MENEKLDKEFEREKMIAMMGRVEALIGYVNSVTYSIDRETIAAILGFELKTNPNKTTE